MNCPRCGTGMGRIQLPSGVEIDCCEEHGVWLDVGELQQIVNYQAQMHGGGMGGMGGGGGGGGRRQAPRQAPSLGQQMMGSAARGAASGVGRGLASGLVRNLFR